MLEPRERGPVGSRSLHGSRCGGIVVPVEAHEPTEAAVWLDAMAQSLRAGAADGGRRRPQRLADERGHLRRCVLATGLIDLNPRLDPRHA